jgi:pimeloyl-ACP methyl ester carboxylesterase
MAMTLGIRLDKCLEGRDSGIGLVHLTLPEVVHGRARMNAISTAFTNHRSGDMEGRRVPGQTKSWMIPLLLAGAGMVLGSGVWLRYRHDIGAARRRLQGCSRLVETSLGLVEYAESGQGPPVLIAHGANGGFDQGLLLAETAGPRYRWIAVSRFGYLRTPLPVDPTPAAQADAYAALLDALHISTATIVGVSAGGPSALRFALRYPDRCTALIMLCAVSDALLPPVPVVNAVAEAVLGSDFPYWLALTAIPSLRLRILGVTAEVVARLSPEDRAWLNAFARTTLPTSLRRTGILNDLAYTVRAEAPALERIAAPTLIVHAADDRLVPIAQAQACARRIPDARLVILPGGGHLLLGQHDRVRAELDAFAQRMQG